MLTFRKFAESQRRAPSNPNGRDLEPQTHLPGRTIQSKHRSSPAKAGDPVFQGVSDRIGKLRRTGSPLSAGMTAIVGAAQCPSPPTPPDWLPAAVARRRAG